MLYRSHTANLIRIRGARYSKILESPGSVDRRFFFSRATQIWHHRTNIWLRYSTIENENTLAHTNTHSHTHTLTQSHQITWFHIAALDPVLTFSLTRSETGFSRPIGRIFRCSGLPLCFFPNLAQFCPVTVVLQSTAIASYFAAPKIRTCTVCARCCVQSCCDGIEFNFFWKHFSQGAHFKP